MTTICLRNNRGTGQKCGYVVKVWICSQKCGYVEECGYVDKSVDMLKKSVDMLAG